MATQYAYDFDFSAVPVYAPQRKSEPQKKPKPDLRRLENQRRVQSKEEERAAGVKVIKVAVMTAFFAAVLCVVCTSFCMVWSARRQQQSALNELELSKSEQVEINAKLNSLVTPDKIAKIATGRLGMIKLPDENKLYSSAGNENEVVYSAKADAAQKSAEDK